MEIPWFPAITQEEIQTLSTLPPHYAWMSCHFDPIGNGISNLPKSLPPDSILILNDQIPYNEHNTEIMIQQLEECIQNWQLHGVLLDLERPVSEELKEIISIMVSSLPCPIACGKNLEIEKLLSVVEMPPLLENPREYFQRKKGAWLELRKQKETYSIDKNGCRLQSGEELYGEISEGLKDTALCVNYRFTVNSENAGLGIWRDRHDRKKIIKYAIESGIDTIIGLYQEFPD